MSYGAEWLRPPDRPFSFAACLCGRARSGKTVGEFVERPPMTNRIALALGAMIVLAIGYDMLRNDMAGSLFIARKFTDLIDWLAFWR